MSKGIGVSVWNGAVDFAKAKKSGLSFAVICAGYGYSVSQKDYNFEHNYNAAKAAGLKLGAYWKSYATSAIEAMIEAYVCLACVCNKSFDLPIFIDSKNAEITKAFCSTIEKAGFKSGVYTPDESKITEGVGYTDILTIKTKTKKTEKEEIKQ